MKKMDKQVKVSIIILNWNGWRDTIECLESIYQNTYANYEVIVVDNGSSDNSIEMIKKWANGKEKISSPYFTYLKNNKPIQYYEYTKAELENGSYLKYKEKFDFLPSNQKLFILKNDKNYGFAKGNNVAIKEVIGKANSKYYLLLNNDTVVEKNFLKVLVKTAEENKNVGAISCRINYYSSPKEIWFSGGYFNLFKYPGYFHSTQLVSEKEYYKSDFISGCAIMIKINPEKKLLAECYHMGCEDAEFCLNLKDSGRLSLVEPRSIIYHKISKSRKRSLKNSLSIILTNFQFLIRNNHFFILIFPKIIGDILVSGLKRRYSKTSSK